MSNNSFIGSISLKVYGGDLISPGVGAWIGVARVVMYLMAITESFVWAYATSYVSSSDPIGIYLVFAVGWFIFMLLLSIDISILTSSRKNPTGDSNGFVEIKFYVSLAIRIILAIASIVAIGPLLNMAVFSKDIDLILSKNYISAIEKKELEIKNNVDFTKEKIREIDNLYDKEQQKQTDLLIELEKELTKEVNGTGGSKKIGQGPIYDNLIKQISRVKSELIDIKNRKEKSAEIYVVELNNHNEKLADFSKARADKDFDTLEAKYGVPGNPNSLNYRIKALNDNIKETEAGKTIRYIIIAFQTLMISTFVLIKVFEPSEVAYYYSPDVQNMYTQYKNGYYDKYADLIIRRSNLNTPISPIVIWNMLKDVSLVQNKINKRNIDDIEKKTTSAVLEGVIKIDEVKDRINKIKENIKILDDRINIVNKKIKNISIDLISKNPQIYEERRLLLENRNSLDARLKNLESIKNGYDDEIN